MEADEKLNLEIDKLESQLREAQSELAGTQGQIDTNHQAEQHTTMLYLGGATLAFG